MKNIKLLSIAGFIVMTAYLPLVRADLLAVPQVIPETKVMFTLSELTPVNYSQLTTDQQKTVATQWKLSVNDYSKYLWLMNNTPAGIYYKDRNLDPSWILGFNAKDDQERQKFVAIAIQNERERLSKELAFQQEFTRMQEQLYPDLAPVLWRPDNTKNKASVCDLQTLASK